MTTKYYIAGIDQFLFDSKPALCEFALSYFDYDEVTDPAPAYPLVSNADGTANFDGDHCSLKPITIQPSEPGHYAAYSIESVIIPDENDPTKLYKTDVTGSSAFSSMNNAIAAGVSALIASTSFGWHGATATTAAPKPLNSLGGTGNDASTLYSIQVTFPDNFSTSFVVYIGHNCNQRLFLPDSAGYATTLVAETSYIELEGGAGRYRKDFIGANARVSAQWTLKAYHYTYLLDLFDFAGKFPIALSLILDESVSSLYVAHLIPGTLKLKSFKGLNYVVGCELEVLSKNTNKDWPVFYE